ncbi:MAG: SGNH/GDSL hydrolase family protein [Deltaproteobacteria bacterium]|nr:SGNH/GDSL hydrolase family protein [Deltaproteobacteria bacterium]
MSVANSKAGTGSGGPGTSPFLSRLLLAIGGSILGLALVEGICRLGVEDGSRSPATLWGSPLMPKDPRDLRAAGRSEARYRYLEIDPKLGWTVAPGAELDEDAAYHADAAGLRTLPGREAFDPGTSSRRIAAFGDSFTHCDEVDFEDCWTHLLERELGTRVFNAGVPGYGTDQAYLRYRAMRERLDPDVVVLGLMIADIKRNVNVFRTFMGGWTAWTKPRFVVVGDGLELINQPAATPAEVPEMIARGHPLLERDWWYDPAEWRREPLDWSVAYRFARARLWKPLERPSYYLYDSEPTIVTAKIVEAFARDVEAAGGRFLCLLIPSEPHLRYGDVVPWQPLTARLAEAGVELVDAIPDLRAMAGTPGLFEPRGHLSRIGNEILARSVARALEHEPERTSGTDELLLVPEADAGLLHGVALGAAAVCAGLRRRSTATPA